MFSVTPVKSSVLYPTAAVLVIIFSMLGIAAFTGLIPGSIAHQDAYDVAARGGAATPADPACARCGVVEQIRTFEAPHRTTGLGAVAGGIAGALLGNSIGHGNGRAAGTLVGAAGGAYAGNAIEKNARRDLRYRVTVRMQDGSVRVLTERAAPAFSVGDQVRLSDSGRIVPMQFDKG